jgi:hypothetical protein
MQLELLVAIDMVTLFPLHDPDVVGFPRVEWGHEIHLEKIKVWDEKR